MAISPVALIFNAVDNASATVKNVAGSITSISFAYNNIQAAIQSVTAQGQALYQKLIGQNVELQQQLLSTQSSLAATNKIISQGVEVKDPTAAIKALDAPVKEAVKSIRQGSLDLVGVTSGQLIPLFQITAQNSANIGANLKQSGDLTLSFAAALGTLGIPLNQARQELTSIYTAQITSDSQLAKSLGLNNEMVNQWKAQGTFVEKLTERLSAFRAGNALAANTIEGVGSNIKEIVDEIGRVVGEPLLQPIVNQLNIVYNFLKDNKDEIQKIAQNAVDFFLEIGTKLGEAVKAVEPVFKTLFEALFTQMGTEASIAASTIMLIVDALINITKVAAPVLQIIANIVLVITQLAATDIGKILLQATLFVAVLSQFAPYLIVIQTGFTIATTRAILFFAATQGSAAAAATLSTIAPVLAAAANAFVLAGGGATGFAAALGASIPSLAAFGTAAAAALAPLLPLILIGGALAVALTFKQTGDLKRANEELEEFRQQNDQLSDESIKLASKLKALNDAERANGKLTEEQTKQRTAYQRVSGDLVKSLEAQIDAIKQVQPANEEQRRTQEVQIAQLQKQIDLQNKLAGGTKLQARDLTNLGNTYEQLNKKVADAQAQFNSGGGGDNQRFKAASEEIVKLTQKQLELGQITASEAEARLSKIRSDSRVEYEVQISAQEAITKAKQNEVNYRVSLSEIEQGKIQALAANEFISESELQRKTSESKKKQLEIQLQAVAAAIEAENKLRQTQVEGQIANLDKQITDAQKKKADAEGKGDKGGARIAQEEIDKLEAQKSTARKSLQIESEKGAELQSQQQKLNTELAQIEGQERQRRRAERLKDFDEQQQVLDARNARKLISESEYAAQSLKIARDKAAVELKQLEEQRAKLAPTDKEGLEAIAAKEAQVQQRITEATEKFQQERAQIRIKGAEDQQRLLDAELASNLVSQADYNKESLDLTKKKAELEIQEIERQRARLPKNDASGRLALDAKEADARKEIKLAEEKFEQEKSKARIAAIDTEQKELEAKLAEGNVTQQQYAQQSLEITQQKLQAELDEVDRQRAKLKTNDSQKLNELAAQEADIRKRQLDALVAYQEQQVQIIERAEKKALDLVQQSETDRLTQIARLEAKNTITKAEAEKQRIDVTRERINQELKLENDKLKQLQALPAFSDPRKEEDRQSQIRASRLKTSQLTKSLVDNEIQRQDAVTKLIEQKLNRQIQATQNASTSQVQSLNKEIQLGQLVAKGLENQNKLLEAQKNLVNSISSFYEGELNIIKETSQNEEEKKQIAETTAQIKLKAAIEQAKIEREILELNIKQKQAALEQEKLQLSIEQAQARAATLTAQAEQKKVEAKQDATPEEKEAARLKVEASVANEFALQQKGAILNQQEQINQREGQQQLQQQERDSQLKEDQARLELAQSRTDEDQKKQETEQVRNRSLYKVGIRPTDDATNELQYLGRNFTLPQGKSVSSLTPEMTNIMSQLQEYILSGRRPTFDPSATQFQMPVIQGIQQQVPNQKIQEIIKALGVDKQPVGTVSINVTNNFTRESSQQAADMTTQKIRKELYNLGVELTRR